MGTEDFDGKNDADVEFVAPTTGEGDDSSGGNPPPFVEQLRSRERAIGVPSLSMRKVGSEENEEALTVEESLKEFERIFKNSRNLLFLTDLDGTVVPFQANPKECKTDPEAKEAIRRIQQTTVTIGVMTGRSGADGAKLLGIPGTIFIGVAGWETYKTDPDDFTKGESIIHEKFVPFARQITNMLSKTREALFAGVGARPESNQQEELTTEIETPDGVIVFEKKALNADFPEGISHVYNLNQIDRSKWKEYTDIIRKVYEEEITDELRKMYQFSPSGDPDPAASGYAISISPFGGEGKDRSLLELMRSDDDINPNNQEPKRAAYMRGLPGGFDGVLFFGDADQDARAIRAANLLAGLSGRHSAGIVISKSEIAGVSGQQKAVHNADVAAGGIRGNAYLLSRIADLAEKYYTPKKLR